MSGTAEKTDPELWEKVKEEVTEGDKGGKPGQWSARKAQMAVQEYKREGGAYKGTKTADNHLVEWTEEDWGTKSGKDSRDTGERYLPKKARDALTPEEYRRTSAKKRADIRAGKQFSSQPKAIAEKTAPFHHHEGGATTHGNDMGEETRTALYAKARAADIPGRSRMSKDQLIQALSGR